MKLLPYSLLLLPLALLACDASDSDDASGTGDASGSDGSGTGSGQGCPDCTCQAELALSGEIDGSAMPTPNDQFGSVWFNQSLEEYVLSPIDEEVMDELGLDKSEKADVERYRYLFVEADYRFLAAEEVEGGGYFLMTKKDITVFFFDLTGHEADLDHPVSVFDLTPVEEARDSGDLDALGDAIRVAADTLRENGHPDVVVAYAADRTEEGAENVFISLLSRSARYAAGGQAWLYDVTPWEGDRVQTITPPLSSLYSVSLRVQPVFPEASDTMSIDVTCMPTDTSGPVE